MNSQQIHFEPKKQEWPALTKRPTLDLASLNDTVQAILADVKQHGDAAVKKYSLEFDKVDPEKFKVQESVISSAASQISPELKNAIDLAAKNIRRFHEVQKENVEQIETMPGVTCWRKSVAIESVGIYIPGGSAPLFSTLLMLGIPAMIAGCSAIQVCTPADKNGNIHPAILYCAQLTGLKNLYKIGGIQAIAAMAYGTETVPAVSKIFGPGNQYVTAAKQLVNSQGVAIDMPAGPSELAVYADETSIPAFVAADLLSQSEHGADSQVVFVAKTAETIRGVQEEINKQLEGLPRHAIAAAALLNSRFIVFEDEQDAFDFLNAYAPEHLIIASTNATSLADKVKNAGSVFLGNYSPESAGDYASGTNHTLPTNGYAKAYSGVSVDSFVKKITYQQLSEEGLQNIGTAIETMAAAEGLDAHKNAVSVRLQRLGIAGEK